MIWPLIYIQFNMLNKNEIITDIIIMKFIKTLKLKHPACHWSPLWPLEVWVHADCTNLGDLAYISYLCLFIYLWSPHGLHSYMINSNTDRTLDVVFSRFRVFFVHNNPEAVPKVVTRISLSMNSFPSGWLWKKKPLNLEKTTSSILSVLLLIYVFTLQFILEEKKNVVCNIDIESNSKIKIFQMYKILLLNAKLYLYLSFLL